MNKKGLIERFEILERQVFEITKILMELNDRINDIDEDVNDLFDEVVSDEDGNNN